MAVVNCEHDGVKSQPIPCAGEKTGGSAGRGAGAANDDPEENEACWETLFRSPWICNRRLPGRSDEGQGEPCGQAEGGFKEAGARWEAA